MSIFLDKKELKKAAKEISTTKIQEAIEAINEVLAERQTGIAVLGQIRELAKQQGFTLEQLGLMQSDSVLTQDGTEAAASTRPPKPKWKTINRESQFFYMEQGTLRLLKTHTMKQGLLDRGIELMPYHKVDQKHASDVDALLAQATAQATENFNQKVVTWNAWASSNGDELLEPR